VNVPHDDRSGGKRTVAMNDVPTSEFKPIGEKGKPALKVGPATVVIAGDNGPQRQAALSENGQETVNEIAFEASFA
jgi:hypothetical protein